VWLNYFLGESMKKFLRLMFIVLCLLCSQQSMWAMDAKVSAPPASAKTFDDLVAEIVTKLQCGERIDEVGQLLFLQHKNIDENKLAKKVDEFLAHPVLQNKTGEEAFKFLTRLMTNPLVAKILEKLQCYGRIEQIYKLISELEPQDLEAKKNKIDELLNNSALQNKKGEAAFRIFTRLITGDLVIKILEQLQCYDRVKEIRELLRDLGKYGFLDEKSTEKKIDKFLANPALQNKTGAEAIKILKDLITNDPVMILECGDAKDAKNPHQLSCDLFDDAVKEGIEEDELKCPHCGKIINIANVDVKVGDTTYEKPFGVDDTKEVGICSICTDPLNPFKQKITFLEKVGGECGHVFHTYCIDDWLKNQEQTLKKIQEQKQEQKPIHTECPICRHPDPKAKCIIGQPLTKEELETKLKERKKAREQQEKEQEKNLFKACRQGNVSKVRDIIRRRPELINARYVLEGKETAECKNGTPLLLAADAGKENVVAFLLDPKEADGKAAIDLKGNRLEINALAGNDGWNFTPLLRAARQGHLAVLELLLGKMTGDERRVALSQRSTVLGQDGYSNYTPLHRAIAAKCNPIVRHLVPFYRDRKEPTLNLILEPVDNSESIIDFAFALDTDDDNGSRIIIPFFLNNGITQMSDKTRSGLLKYYIDQNESAHLQLLLSKTPEDKKAIMIDFAFERKNPSSIPFFLNNGITRMSDKTRSGLLDYYLDQNDLDNLQLLLSKTPDEKKAVIIDSAFEHKNPDIIPFFLNNGITQMSDETRLNLLEYYINQKEPDNIRLLFSKTPDAKKASLLLDNKASLLRDAIGKEDENLVKTMIELGFNPDVEIKRIDARGLPVTERLLDVVYTRYQAKHHGLRETYKNILKQLFAAGARTMSIETRAGMLYIAQDDKDVGLMRSLLENLSDDDKAAILHVTIKKGYEPRVIFLLDQGFNPNAVLGGNSLFDVAYQTYQNAPRSRDSSIKMIKALLRRNVKNMKPETRKGIVEIKEIRDDEKMADFLENVMNPEEKIAAYHQALDAADFNEIKHWIGKVGDVNVVYDGKTPMQRVNPRATAEIIKFLLEKGVTLDPYSIFVAIRELDVELAMLIITTPEFDPNIKNDDGFTPLDLAWRKRGEAERLGQENITDITKELIDALIGAGAKVMSPRSIKIGDQNFSPLFVAARSVDRSPTNAKIALILLHNPIIKQMIAAGDEPINNLLHKLLLVASEFRDEDTAIFLIDNKANVDFSGNRGYTPLHFAAENGLEKLAQKLIDKKADVNAKNSRDETPLHCAVYAGHEGVVKILLQAMPQQNLESKGIRFKGGTILGYCAMQGSKATPAIAQLLIDAGADPMNVDISIAEYRHNSAIVKIIEEAQKEHKIPSAAGDGGDQDPLITALTTVKAKLIMLSQTLSDLGA